MRLLTLLSLTAILTLLLGGLRASAQGMPLPTGTNVPVPRMADTPPSMQNPNVQRGANARIGDGASIRRWEVAQDCGTRAPRL